MKQKRSYSDICSNNAIIMNITIDKEDREVLLDLLESIISIKQLFLKLSLLAFSEVKKGVLGFIYSLSEFAPQEIKEHGLEEILFRRALRFFGLKIGEEADQQSRKKQRKKTVKFILKRFFAFILTPVYIIILVMIKIRGENKQKNVKNKFKT
tara:strand:+ start:31621 stop:32079 length:459 start_codon:yes stop_codon:yes gene_type:complete